MCGIFAYIGNKKKNAIEIVLNGLKKLEYRGYDSSGIVGIKDGEIIFCKELGKLSVLQEELSKKKIHLEMALGHTRWATHGIPTKENAHPHFDEQHSLAIVHNGIFENHEALRAFLSKKNAKFQTETDTEVVAHFISSFYQGDLLEAVQKAVPHLKGTFAFAVVHKEHPDEIIAVSNLMPLVIGLGKDEVFLSSDAHAFAEHTKEVIFLANTEIAQIKVDKVEVFNCLNESIDKKTTQITTNFTESNKNQYEHYTLKEIFEQPEVIQNAFKSRFNDLYGTAVFEEIDVDLSAVENVLIIGCGTSYHAGLIASYMIEDLARVPVRIEIASEFRYRNPVVLDGTLVIAVSQSGETADTLAAMRELQARGVKVLSICNVQGSTLARESDHCIFLNAGPEIGVCSTKAFTSQIIVLTLLALLLARTRYMSKEQGQEILLKLKELPDQVKEVLSQADYIQEIAKKYAHYENAFFVGRQYMFPASLEGALKLKEISYINANGYAAGELKHGPIALLNEECLVVALCCNQRTLEKTLSNLAEVKARKAPLIAIIDVENEEIKKLADDVIFVPSTIDELACIPTAVIAQLLAYFIAKERGADIDQPRNLAKSVTVE